MIHGYRVRDSHVLTHKGDCPNQIHRVVIQEEGALPTFDSGLVLRTAALIGIEGCEYLDNLIHNYRGPDSHVHTHKGDCRNPIHRVNNRADEPLAPVVVGKPLGESLAVRIEGCEYLVNIVRGYQLPESRILTHKGNCPNPAHRPTEGAK